MSSATNAAHISDSVAQSVGQNLEQLVHDLGGVKAAVVASADGFSVARAFGAKDGPDRLAAMTSSMLALASAVAKELDLGSLDVLVLEASSGKVLMLSIPGRIPLLLMLCCNESSVMGNVLWRARQTVQAVTGLT